MSSVVAYISQQSFCMAIQQQKTNVEVSRILHNKSFNAAILAERVIKATCCDWLLATTNVEFKRTTNVFKHAYIGNNV